MAMRVAFGSMRLTKDIDFDRTADMSTSAVKGLLKRGMQVAAQVAGIRGVAIGMTKVRWEDDVLQISSTVDQWLGQALDLVVGAPGQATSRERERPS